VRNPRHMLTAEETALPYYRAVRATGPEILKSFRTGSIRSECDAHPARPAKARASASATRVPASVRAGRAAAVGAPDLNERPS